MQVSVVIRTKDEADWIGRCLFAVCNQDHPNFDVIVVDSGSTDDTIGVVERFVERSGVKLVHYSGKYFPGKALNMGAENTSGELIAFLSAHCIPLNDKWLERLAVCFADPEIGGVYGRQEPLPDSTDIDKRDLWTVFGKESKIQKKDYFFHNANSMVRRELWRQTPFDETLLSIEDQAWAKAIIAMGYGIQYEPHASVHHYHGIHQNLDDDRAERVVKVIDLLKKSGEIW